MAKFDMFDESTWKVDRRKIENEINNKGTGHMGQKIPIIRQIRQALTQKITPTSPEFRIATELRERNIEAFKIMDIIIRCEDENISEYVSQCDHILITWDDAKTQEAKNNIWRGLIPYFKDLEKFVPSNKDWSYNKETVESLLQKHVFKSSIEGNEAWKVYLAAILDKERYVNILAEMNKNAALLDRDDDPESHDPPSSDEFPSFKDFTDDN